MLVNAIYFPTGAHVKPEEIIIDGYQSIQHYTEGVFDAVRQDLPNGKGTVVGYVNDEGLITGMDYNYLASALFQRNLFGPCVVTWGTSPNGEYDGDDYDMPEWFLSFVNGFFLSGVADAYNEAIAMTLIYGIAEDYNVITVDEHERLMDVLEAHTSGGCSPEDYAWACGLMEEVNAWAEDNLTEEMIAEFEAKLLEGNDGN